MALSGFCCHLRGRINLMQSDRAHAAGGPGGPPPKINFWSSSNLTGELRKFLVYLS